MEFLVNNPIIAIMLLCLCSPPGLLPLAVIWLLARRYDVRNPFTPRGGSHDNTL